jgi:hypothetical protein
MNAFDFELNIDEAALNQVRNLSLVQLEELETAIQYRRMELMVAELTRRDVPAFVERTGVRFPFILVYSPDAALPNAWATVAECRRLLDTVANLPLADAYRRWYPKVSNKLGDSAYTEADARRDTRAAREQLAADYAAGKIDGQGLADLYRTTSFMDLAE